MEILNVLLLILALVIMIAGLLFVASVIAALISIYGDDEELKN